MAVNENDIIEVAARMEWGGAEDVMNIYQFRVGSIVDSDELAIIDDLIDIMEDVYTFLVPFQTNQMTYADIAFKNITQGQVYGTFAWDSLVSGTATQEALPPGVAALINFATFFGRVILKKYFGGLVEGDADLDSTWVTLFLTALANVAQYLLNDRVETAATYSYGYNSIKAGGFVLPVSGVVSEIPAYQRRRKQGRGS